MSSAVLLSGGMDSTTLLADVQANYDKDVRAIAFMYGQRHRDEEYRAQQFISNVYKIQLKRIKVDLGQIGGSPLTDPNLVVPMASDKQQESTVVPMRNTILLSLAAAWAVTQGIRKLYFGACKDDQAAYPDCRPGYVDQLQRVFQLGEFPIRAVQSVQAPYWNMSKSEILKLGLSLNVPYHVTHTCYKGMRPACGVCDACVERLNAFKELDTKDPLPYV